MHEHSIAIDVRKWLLTVVVGLLLTVCSSWANGLSSYSHLPAGLSTNSHLSADLSVHSLLNAGLSTQSSVLRRNQQASVMVVWPTDDTDPAYKIWNKKLRQEFVRHGIDADLHPYYGEIGMKYEHYHVLRMIAMLHELDSMGKRPDIILCRGDYTHWLLDITPDSLMAEIPIVAFGLRDSTYLERMYRILESKEDYIPKRTVEIHDTLYLQESLEFFDFIENLQPAHDTTPRWPRHQFVGLLDYYSQWTDSIYYVNLMHQLRRLDNTRYINCVDHLPHDTVFRTHNAKGYIALALSTLRDPFYSANIVGSPVSWICYRQKSRWNLIQMKHDEISRSLTEGPVLGRYYTLIAEDFLVQDSCIGGMFVSDDVLLHDAVQAAVRLLHGETPEQIGRLMHEPGYHINWDIMRDLGYSVDQMPDYVQLYNTTMSDYYPRATRAFEIVLIIAFIVLLVVSIIYSSRTVRTQQARRKEMQEHAKRAILSEQLLEATIDACGAFVWDESMDKVLLRERIEASTEWMQILDGFFNTGTDGVHEMQFFGRIDGNEPHWYEIHAEVHHDDNGNVHRRGYILNIDWRKDIEQQQQEAHEMIMSARAREGFLASMNHEIRTPLHAVVGFSMEIARTDVAWTDEDLALYANIIDTNAALLTKTINNILLVTLMSNANVVAHCRDERLSDLLNPANWPIAKGNAERRGNQLIIQSAPDDILLHCDREMMLNILDNLLLNASNFSAECSRIEIGWAQNEEGTRIWVSDEGIGIEKRQMPLIFTKFFKVNSFTPGCGLGLFISNEYMTLMGGKIQVESEVKKGSTFTLHFPACKQ